MQPKEIELIATDTVVAGVLNPTTPVNVNRKSIPTRDVPAATALARIYNTVNPVL